MLNKVILQGRLTRDIELKQTNAGLSCASFSLACKRDAKGETTDFINCSTWRHTAEFVSKYFHKGDMMLIEGRLVTRKFTSRSGEDRTVTEVNVDNVNFCGGKKDDGNSNEQSGTASGFVEYDESDDDFPF